mmetsp:Transcript_29814/g.74985  ORF Transcript_29814/g.74985 Transcript_29814/m.74985 type:complete len:235 (+) Transcript_29814:289-993(+)
MTFWADSAHLSATQRPASGPSFGAAWMPGNVASKRNAPGPQRSQKAAASARKSSSHVGSEDHFSKKRPNSPKSSRAFSSFPSCKFSQALVAVRWHVWNLLTWIFLAFSALAHCLRLQAVATRTNCCERRVTKRETMMTVATGRTEPSKNNAVSLLLRFHAGLTSGTLTATLAPLPSLTCAICFCLPTRAESSRKTGGFCSKSASNFASLSRKSSRSFSNRICKSSTMPDNTASS